MRQFLTIKHLNWYIYIFSHSCSNFFERDWGTSKSSKNIHADKNADMCVIYLRDSHKCIRNICKNMGKPGQSLRQWWRPIVVAKLLETIAWTPHLLCPTRASAAGRRNGGRRGGRRSGTQEPRRGGAAARNRDPARSGHPESRAG